MPYDPGDYRYDPPTDSPFNDIDQYVPILLAAVEDWLDNPSVWPDESVTEALGYMGDLKAWIQELSNTMFTPIGGIMSYAGTTAPDGWLLCDGAVYEKADYPALWTVLGSHFEVSSSEFATPDMRQRSPIGFDSAASPGNYGQMNNPLGAATHTLTSSEMPAHTHIQNGHNHTQDAHTHTQNSHNHTQDAHTHTQNSHNHTQDAHTHTQNSHNHTQDSHVHTQPAHSHPVNKRDNATAFGTGIPASSNSTTPTSTVTSDNAQPGVNGTVATNQAATATNQNATATNQAATATNQNATATNQAATATNQSTGGGAAHNNIHPVLVLNFIVRAQ